MLRFQHSLPQLPVPPLKETAARYLKSLHPLLTANEFKKSKSAVEDFVKPGGVGEELQSKLQARANDQKTKNWLYEWWNDAAYLSYRDPVVPYVSYFYSYRDDRRRKDQLKRAAAISAAALSFKELVDKRQLEPEYLRKQPLCMDSYQFMFHTCRIPSIPADYAKTYPFEDNKHFVVARKGRFFKVDYEIEGIRLNATDIEMQLKKISEKAAHDSANGIGALTSENRDSWAKSRALLRSLSAKNEANLRCIESSAFVICLDDAAPYTLEERAHQYWHGDGQNRWYDKPLNFIINENGTAGFIGEHSMMDGTPTHRLSDTICRDMFTTKEIDNSPARPILGCPEELVFQVNDELLSAIDAARKNFNTTINQHELRVQAYQGYGKALIKKFKCSPDAYVQMIIQLAYFKMFGQSRPTYESASTRGHQLGRTETCRTVSDESVAFCNAMQDSEVDASLCLNLAQRAMKAHVKYISDASAGHGVDRHLFGLKKLLRLGSDMPAIFTDPAYTYSSTWYLSTSQISSEFFNGYGWSQVVDDGFGIAYMVVIFTKLNSQTDQ